MSGHPEEHKDKWAFIDIDEEKKAEEKLAKAVRSKDDYFTELLQLVNIAFGNNGSSLPVAMVPGFMSEFAKKIINN